MQHKNVKQTAEHAPRMRRDSYRKRMELISSATEMFLELGYEAASMNQLVSRTRSSKSTLYKHFESKEGLFIAVLDESLREHLASVYDLDLTRLSIEGGLSKIADTALEVLTSEMGIGFARIVYAESERIPEVGRLYYEHGPQLGIRGLASYLREMNSAEKIDCRNPDAAAEYFWGMLLHKPMLDRYCGVTAPMSTSVRKRYIKRIVRDFTATFL